MKERSEVIEQVLKLLALADGTNFAEEAEVARRKAASLLTKHDLQLDEVISKEEGMETIYHATDKKSLDKYFRRLANYIARFNGVYYLISNGYKQEKFLLVGRRVDIENTIYMIDVLFGQLRRQENEASKKQKASHGHSFDGKDVNGFRCGFAEGVNEKLLSLLNKVKEARQEMGLVVVPASVRLHNMAEASYKGKVRNTMTRSSEMSSNGYQSGKEAGRNASITRGVGSKSNGTLRLA